MCATRRGKTERERERETIKIRVDIYQELSSGPTRGRRVSRTIIADLGIVAFFQIFNYRLSVSSPKDVTLIKLLL